MPTLEELQDYSGRIGLLLVREHTGIMRFPVVVIDAKSAWGNLRFKVRPHTDMPTAGAAWVDAKRVELR